MLTKSHTDKRHVPPCPAFTPSSKIYKVKLKYTPLNLFGKPHQRVTVLPSVSVTSSASLVEEH